MRESTVTDTLIRESPRSLPARTERNSKRPSRILFLVSAHNGLSQRAWIALTELVMRWRSRSSTRPRRWRRRSALTIRS